jgi:antirestriction protein
MWDYINLVKFLDEKGLLTAHFDEYDYKEIINEFEKSKEEKRKEKERILKEKQLNCKHENTRSEVSDYHPNGQPDRWSTYCKDCGKRLR